MANLDFVQLTAAQQEAVQGAYGRDLSAEGLRPLECAGCAVYLGATPLGENTYYWHYGASEGFVTLPIGDDRPDFDYGSGNLFVGGREFTTDGKEVPAPPFRS